MKTKKLNILIIDSSPELSIYEVTHLGFKHDVTKVNSPSQMEQIQGRLKDFDLAFVYPLMNPGNLGKEKTKDGIITGKILYKMYLEDLPNIKVIPWISSPDDNENYFWGYNVVMVLRKGRSMSGLLQVANMFVEKE
jgi:hypothetical protein